MACLRTCNRRLYAAYPLCVKYNNLLQINEVIKACISVRNDN